MPAALLLMTRMPQTLKDEDVRVEFTTQDGEAKAYLIKKYLDQDTQKDVWDMLVIRKGELRTKIAREGDRKGRGYAESKIIGAGTEASQPTATGGVMENASTPHDVTADNISSSDSDSNTLYQNKGENARGSISFSDNETLIRLFKDSADFSTFVHEIGHLFARDMENLVATEQAPEQIVKDLERLKAFTAEFADLTTLQGFYEKTYQPQRKTFAGRDFSDLSSAELSEVRNVAEQEKLADAFVTYIKEGKAPSVELRPVFQRFKAWLQKMYSAVSGHISINDDVRAVFDRMLASEQDMRLAEQVHQAQESELRALNEIASQMLTEQEQAKLNNARQEAASVSREQRLKKVLQAYYRAGTNRKEIRARATDTVNAMPVYAAIDLAIAEGGINYDAVRENYGVDFAKELAKRRPALLQKEGAVSLNDLALASGFDNEWLMLEAMRSATGKGKEINTLVRAEVAERESSIRQELGLDTGPNPGDFDYYSDKRLEALEIEARALSRASGERTPGSRAFGTAETLRKLARHMLESMPYNEASNVGRLSAAEARQAVRAAKAAANGSIDEAADAKRRQAINHAMVLEALQFQHEADVFSRALKRFNKSDRMVFEYQEQIRALAQRYKLTPGVSPHKPDERRPLGEFIENATSDSVFDTPPFSDFITLEQIPESMTLGQMREIRDVVRWLAEEGNPGEARLVSDGVTGSIDTVTTEYRCPAPLTAGRICNRLLGVGEATKFETICPKCGAKLTLKNDAIMLKIQSKKRR